MLPGNPHQLELALANVLRQSNALAYFFSLRAEGALVILVGEGYFSTSFRLVS